jgi:GntR family transcriptional regulator
MIETRRPLPLFAQIADALRARILAREEGFRSGDKLPCMQDLAKELHVSRTTVRNAIDALCYGGYTEVVVGRGTFVLPERFWRS